MGFNESKCKVLHIGPSDSGYEYRVNSTSLEPTTDERIWESIDHDLKFHMHVSKALNKASRMLGLVSACDCHRCTTEGGEET